MATSCCCGTPASPAPWKGRGTTLATSRQVDKTIAEQLAQLGLKPDDIDIVGISHMHSDHTGQAAEFPQAELLIGKGDFEETKGKDDPFGPWRKEGEGYARQGDIDVFGDGAS